jgi:hypothetical protein
MPPVESYTTTGLYDGLMFSELKERTLDRLKQKALNYDRYSEASIERALNDALIEAVRITRCIKSFAIITLKAKVSQYKPPSEMLLLNKAFFYQSATSYYELPQVSRAWLDRFKRGWRIQNGDPLYMYPGDHWGNLRKIGFTPTPKTDGTDYTTSPDTGIYVSESGMTTTGNITGTNNAASATVCTDTAARTLSDLGVLVGMMAVNVTDSSSGQITAVSGSTFTVTLTGGTANTWAAGDSFTILAGEYGVVTDWTDDEEYLFTAEIGGMVDVDTVVHNVYLEFTKRPIPLQLETQYPQLPPELHQYIPDGATWIIKRAAPKGSDDFNEAMAAKQDFLSNIKEGYIDPEAILEDDACLEFHL